MNDARKIAEELQDVTDGLVSADIAPVPPRVHWGEDFQSWDDAKKISYLTKFAEGMNDAVDRIQRERDELGRLVELKEKQLMQAKPMIEQNNMLLQHEITRMNEYRQETNSTISRLNARIRELESAGGNLD